MFTAFPLPVILPSSWIRSSVFLAHPYLLANQNFFREFLTCCCCSLIRSAPFNPQFATCRPTDRQILRAGLTRQVEVWLAIGLQSVTQAIGGHNPLLSCLRHTCANRVSIIEADFGLGTRPMACQLCRVFFKRLCP